MRDNFRHDLINSIIIIRRVMKSSRPIIEKMIAEKLEQEKDIQLTMLSESMSVVEKEIEKLNELCGEL